MANRSSDSCFHNGASRYYLKMGWLQYIWHNHSCSERYSTTMGISNIVHEITPFGDNGTPRYENGYHICFWPKPISNSVSYNSRSESELLYHLVLWHMKLFLGIQMFSRWKKTISKFSRVPLCLLFTKLRKKALCKPSFKLVPIAKIVHFKINYFCI